MHVLRASRGTFGVCFFFNDTATTEIYTLSLHDALPISIRLMNSGVSFGSQSNSRCMILAVIGSDAKISDRGCRSSLSLGFPTGSAVLLRVRSEEHTSELQSRLHLVCRLLLEKKKNKTTPR